MPRYITMPAIGKRATLRQYVSAWKVAKANPDRLYARGLTTDCACTGAEIVQQFRDGMHDRINQAVPYITRGKPASERKDTEQ